MFKKLVPHSISLNDVNMFNILQLFCPWNFIGLSQPQFCRVRESNLLFSCCLLLFYKGATADIISVYKTAVVTLTRLKPGPNPTRTRLKSDPNPTYFYIFLLWLVGTRKSEFEYPIQHYRDDVFNIQPFSIDKK